MAAQYYPLTELKQLALDGANVMGTAYASDDADKAYSYAVGGCGFENPASSDINYAARQKILLDYMALYFYKDVQKKYLLNSFDVGDLKLGQISREIRNMIEGLEASLDRAKKDPNTAGLFINAAGYFGKVVAPSGIVDDAIGQSITQADLARGSEGDVE